MRYSNDSVSLLPRLTLFAEATITRRLLIQLFYAAFRQLVPSQILFTIKSGFVASYLNTANFYSEWPLKLVFAALISNVRSNTSGYSGLVVARCLQVPKFAGSNPAEAVRIFKGEKSSAPSFGGEVKPSVRCRRFTACKRFLNVMWKLTFRQNYRIILTHKVPPFAAWISRIV